jgi:hypothetical protein
MRYADHVRNLLAGKHGNTEIVRASRNRWNGEITIEKQEWRRRK